MKYSVRKVGFYFAIIDHLDETVVREYVSESSANSLCNLLNKRVAA